MSHKVIFILDPDFQDDLWELSRRNHMWLLNPPNNKPVAEMVGLLHGMLTMADRQHGPRVVPFVLWWWCGIVFGGMLTESPQSSQRLVTLTVPTCILLAYAAGKFVDLAKSLRVRTPVVVVRALVGIGFSAYIIDTYFLRYSSQLLYGGRHAELATVIAPELNELKADNRFLFLGAP